MKAFGRFTSLLLLISLVAPIFGQGQDLNLPPRPAAKQLVEQAVVRAELDRPREAILFLQKALSISPNYFRAHLEYRYIKTNYLDRYDEVEAEYHSLIRRFPTNPVFLLAENYRSRGTDGREALRRVVELAPQWAWAHYAQAVLIQTDNPEGAVRELMTCIDRDSSAVEAYQFLIELQERRLHRIDDALRTAERLAAQKDIRPTLRLPELWRLRLLKAGQSKDSQSDLRTDLEQLSGRTRDLDMLQAIRSAYLDLLSDPNRARFIEERIRQIDPRWTPQRGWPYTQIKFNQSRVPRSVVLVNRQIAIQEKVQEITQASEIGLTARISQLEGLLAQRPSLALQRIIHEEIFGLAVRAGNLAAARKSGNILLRLDPSDAALLAQLAVVYADKKEYLAEALRQAGQAERLTSSFQPVRRPANTPPEFFASVFPEQAQREAYKRNRALALDALGWVLVQLKRSNTAEPLLRQALAIEPSEARLRHLAKALQELGRTQDASATESEANRFLADRVRKQFTTEKVADLQMESIEGQRFRLAELKTKVVILNFWATWCVPCRQEMPFLERLYQKFKDQGLIVIAISTDDDVKQVRTFVTSNKLTLPVVNLPALPEAFGIQSIPANLFIDRAGNLRYRTHGFEEGNEREIEAVIVECLKEKT
jgi:thiol-disulfide isomerase/thioredoxin